MCEDYVNPKERDQNPSSFGLCHSELGTNNVLNQDIINLKYFHSIGAKYLNKGINFTIEHSTQAIFLVLSNLLHTANAQHSEADISGENWNPYYAGGSIFMAGCVALFKYIRKHSETSEEKEDDLEKGTAGIKCTVNNNGD